MTSYHSTRYPFPIDLNEDQSQPLLSSNSILETASSSSSLSYPIFITSQEDYGGYYSTESQVLNHHQQQGKTCVGHGGGPSCDHYPTLKHDNKSVKKLSVQKKDERNENQGEKTEMKWLSSKMRLMKKMMTSDQTFAYVPETSTHQKLEDHHHHQKDGTLSSSSSSPLQNDNGSITSSNNSNNPVRVCSDCNTTKTPLWRSGPRGPKSLCNACGIRQRKARRAMAAAAAAAAGANGVIVAADQVPTAKTKPQHKGKRTTNNSHLPFKKRRKYTAQGRGSRKKLCFEDLTIILSKNSACQRVFPQDEKEAAILLMALSYGLVHG